MADTNRLIAEVAARNGIRIDAGDPAFCVVTLSELMLQEAGRNVAEDVRLAATEFVRTAEKVQIRSGTILAEQINEALTSSRQCLQQEIRTTTAEAAEKLTKLHQANVRFVAYWIATGIALAVGIFVSGVLVGWAWR